MLHHTVCQDEQVSRLTGGVRGERRGGVADRPQHIQRARDRQTERERDRGRRGKGNTGMEKKSRRKCGGRGMHAGMRKMNQGEEKRL